jgi:hypothetical protein
MRFTSTRHWKIKGLCFLLLSLAMLPGRSARAQVDVTGYWSPRNYNDGMDIGDYTGIPLNEAGRLRAETWHPEQTDLPENMCRPHPMDIGLRTAVSQLYVSRELDSETRQPVGLRLHMAWQEPEQVIWMDGRPHPSANAPYKWSGFSTGHWERNTLVYTTDHLKEAYLTRTGVPKSDKATVTTRVKRYGNILTMTFIINDPAYLTEPYIRESSWVYAPNLVIPPFPCEIIPDGSILAAGDVPSYLPGKNDVLSEFAAEYAIPPEAALGGAETTYPEYIKKMKTMKTLPRATTVHYKRSQ